MKCSLRFLFAAALTAGLSREASAQYASVAIDTLSIKTAVELAIQYHPSVRGAEAGVQSASAGYRQAFSAYLPVVSFAASGSRTEGWFVFNPSSPIRDQKYNNYSGVLSAQQTIFDFGRSIGRVGASSDLVDAATMDQASTRNSVIMNVEIAFFTLMQAEQVERVNEAALAAAERHLSQAKAFYSVGTRPQLDVTKAEVDVANANVNLITARNQVRVTRVQLENTIGVSLPASAVVRDSFSVDIPIPAFDSVRTAAFAGRPELLAAKSRVSASSSLVTAAWTQHLPLLSAFGTYTWSNFALTPLFPRWNAGLSVTLPIFQGFAINAQVDQARANEEIAKVNLDQLEQSITLELEQNYLAIKEARERLVATYKLVEEADQALVLAERQYAAGAGTLLDVTDAQLIRSNARITNIQALFDLNSSYSRLLHAVGVMP